MTSRRKLIVSAPADRDVRSILRYTQRTWGERQRDAYADDLARAMDELVDFPGLGRKRDDISLGLHSRPVREHVIYYLFDDVTVTIARVLHARMDAADAFRPTSPP
jgi:toxin ParE1/3/4